jgi:large subunit ribosomal protein L14
MIQSQTILRVADNSGAKTVKCIKILNANPSNYASVGDCIIVSVQSVRSGITVKVNRKSLKHTIKKGQVYKALIIRTKKNIKDRKYGFSLKFQTNDVVLLNTQGNLIGSRIFGPVTRELRARSQEDAYKKILSQAKRLL